MTKKEKKTVVFTIRSARSKFHTFIKIHTFAAKHLFGFFHASSQMTDSIYTFNNLSSAEELLRSKYKTSSFCVDLFIDNLK